MIKHIVLFIVLFCSTQSIIAQKKPNEIKKQAELAFESGDYETTIVRINEMESIFKQMPFYYLSIRIKAIASIIAENPGRDFQRIVSARKFISDYLKNPSAKEQDASYYGIIDINKVLESYPKDESSFIIYKDKFEKEAIETERRDGIIKLRTAKLQPYLKLANLNFLSLGYITDSEFENVFNNAKDKYEKEVIEIEIKEKLKTKRTDILQPYSNFVSNDVYLKLGELSNVVFDKILKTAKEKAKINTPNSQLNSFSSIGFQSGEIAKYGILYERGGSKFMGFHLSLRSSLSSEQDIINGVSTKNKTEIEIGPNFRIANRIYLNIGLGYGNYNRLLNNDYAGEVYVEKTGYSVLTTGIMFRASRVISINCGLSFMDIEKKTYKPEITFGASFNLKNKNTSQINSYKKGQEYNVKSSKKYKPKLSSFSSLGYQSGEIAKYGILYETGGRRTIGFHISARTTLNPEEIINGNEIENRKEIELGPNIKISNHIYLNLGIGYGNYQYLYLDKIGYYIASTGVMYRTSRIINLNLGLSYIDIDKKFNKPEMTFGISFNLRGRYKY